MHPIIENKKFLAGYFFLWIVLGIAFVSFLVPPPTALWLYTSAYAIPLFIIYGGISLSAWYVCKFFPIRKTGIVKLVLILGAAAFINSSLWFLIASEWSNLFGEIFIAVPEDPFTVLNTRFFFIVGITLYLLSGAGHYLVILHDEAQAAQRRVIESTVLAREAELKALRSQINPHFLFNSLNSVSALISTDQKAARRMTELLADFFRKSLEAGRKPFITLREELELASYYLDIERIRFGHRLEIAMKVHEPCLSKTVPPLILQPVVENAVKHGIAHLIDGGTVTIRARCGKKSLTVTVENPCDPDRPRGIGNKLGLANIRDRLQTVYDTKSNIKIKEDSNIFRVDISINE